MGIAFPLLVAFTSRLDAQGDYTLDDWVSVASVSSFASDGSAIYYTSDDAESGTTQILRVSTIGSEPDRMSACGDG